ncbi:MAG TPA: SDR family oxidoreductase [Stellaceae bacterium]|nr:SDR family oxidoreductase [Stellaceae bacterium]
MGARSEEADGEAGKKGQFDLGGRVALVTGAGQGLGLEIADALARAGAHVVLNGRQAERLESAAERIQGQGGTASPLPFDIADPDAVAAAFEGIGAAFSSLDILVSNVGIRHRFPLADISSDDLHHVLEVNLVSAFHLAKAAVGLMIPRGRGRIIMVTSIAGPLGRANDAAYIAAKGGLAGFVRALAVEFGPHGITTNAIAPGYFATETNAAMVDDPEVEAFVKRRIPLQRWGEPKEIAGAAVFLASDAASYVNGHVLTVDGGLSASF